MRELAVCVLLVSAGFAGCIGSKETSAGRAATNNPADLNPWQAGLDDHYPAPDVAERRSAEERRSNVAEPGDPEFAVFDAVVQEYMTETDTAAAQLAIMYGDELRYERGYGYVDPNGTESTDAATMFRLASITKPMTAAVVAMQVEQGLYNWTDPVFCLDEDPAPNCRLPIDPHPAIGVEDDRIGNIEVQHLVNHTSGWTMSTGQAMLFSPGPIKTAEELGIASPPSTWRTTQHLLGTTLTHEPGETRKYTNIGYLLAGLVAEAATGADLSTLYEAYLFDPLEVTGDIEPGRTLPEERNPRETFYNCRSETRSVFEPNETVCWPDGGWSLETSLPAFGLVGTAAATAAVYEVYSQHGSTYEEAWSLPDAGPIDTDVNVPWTYAKGHTGSLDDGTEGFAVTVVDEASPAENVHLVVLLNQRNNGDSLKAELRPDEGRHDLRERLTLLAWKWAQTHATPAKSIADVAP